MNSIRIVPLYCRANGYFEEEEALCSSNLAVIMYKSISSVFVLFVCLCK